MTFVDIEHNKTITSINKPASRFILSKAPFFLFFYKMIK
jgi:hypothetical protein